MNAFLVIDKPAGITSHDVVAAVRAVTGVKKVGHTGTLDPFATGVLPLALGNCTRLIQYLDESVKVYVATVQLGAVTDTGDPTGEVIETSDVPKLSADAVREVLVGFRGDRMQTPPAYSAVKVQGKKLYEYARKGKTVEAKARPIFIHDIELLGLRGDELDICITCSRGTYARVLADEIAIELGTRGYLTALQRTRSGPFHLEQAVTMPRIASLVAPGVEAPWTDVLMSRGPKSERVSWAPRDDVRAALQQQIVRPLDALSHLPIQDVDAVVARKVRNGAKPPALNSVPVGGRYLVVEGADLVALAERTAGGTNTLRVMPA